MKTTSLRGFLLLAILGLISCIAIAALSLLDLGLSTLQLSARNEIRASAQAVAESELEYLFFSFKQSVISGTLAQDIPVALTAIADNAESPTTVRDAFLAAHRNQGWIIKRSLYKEFDPIYGSIPGTTKTGNYCYITARVEISMPASGSQAGVQPVRLGRRFVNSNTSVFQYSLFYEGDLELNPGISIVVNGDVYSSGDIYMGPASGRVLTVSDTVRMLGSKRFNVDADGNTLYYNPDAGTAPTALVAPVFANGTGTPGTQLEALDQPENLLGGINVTTVASDTSATIADSPRGPKLFGPSGSLDSSLWTLEQWATAISNVNRSMLVPPPDLLLPGDTGTTLKNANEYPNLTAEAADHPQIAPRRTYNRAGIVIDITDNGTTATPTIYARQADNSLVDRTSAYITILTDFNSSPSATAYANDVYDKREGRYIRVTELNIATLAALLNADATLPCNGLIYVNFRNSTSSAPSALRLINGAALPVYGRTASDSTVRWRIASTSVTTSQGVSFATNAGLYVKGHFNTQRVTLTDAQTSFVSAMLMGDAITALSYNWDDADSASNMTDPPDEFTPIRVADVIDAPETPAADTVESTTDMRINAGLITGSVASADGDTSGGAQNLVRYLEDWRDHSTNPPGRRTVTFNGSVGRIFNCSHFTRQFQQSGDLTPNVYYAPTRNYRYDSNLAKFSPVGNPTTTEFSRGNLFYW